MPPTLAPMSHPPNAHVGHNAKLLLCHCHHFQKCLGSPPPLTQIQNTVKNKPKRQSATAVKGTMRAIPWKRVNRAPQQSCHKPPNFHALRKMHHSHLPAKPRGESLPAYSSRSLPRAAATGPTYFPRWIRAAKYKHRILSHLVNDCNSNRFHHLPPTGSRGFERTWGCSDPDLSFTGTLPWAKHKSQWPDRREEGKKRGAMTLSSERSRSALVYRQLQSSPPLNEMEGTAMEHALRFLKPYTGGLFSAILFLNSPGFLCVDNTLSWMRRIINLGGKFHYQRIATPSRAHQGNLRRMHEDAALKEMSGLQGERHLLEFEHVWKETETRKVLYQVKDGNMDIFSESREPFLHRVGPLKSTFIIEVLSDEKTSLRTTWVLKRLEEGLKKLFYINIYIFNSLSPHYSYFASFMSCCNTSTLYFQFASERKRQKKAKKKPANIRSRVYLGPTSLFI